MTRLWMGKMIKALRSTIPMLDTRIGSRAAVERIRGGKLTKIRQRILLRDGYECRVCGQVTVNLEIDHVTPLHLGGTESDENRQALCRKCHSEKTEREEKERGWIDDGTGAGKISGAHKAP